MVNKLRRAADEIGLPVGEILNLRDEECAVLENDPLAGFKVHARGFVVAGHSVVSYMPLETTGFTAILPNGEKFHIGFSIYPKRIELVSGKFVSTRAPGVPQWASYVRTVVRVESEPLSCISSHLKVLALLREAEDLGILTEITDPYQQWQEPDRMVFERVCIEQHAMVAAH